MAPTASALWLSSWLRIWLASPPPIGSCTSTAVFHALLRLGGRAFIVALEYCIEMLIASSGFTPAAPMYRWMELTVPSVTAGCGRRASASSEWKRRRCGRKISESVARDISSCKPLTKARQNFSLRRLALFLLLSTGVSGSSKSIPLRSASARG